MESVKGNNRNQDKNNVRTPSPPILGNGQRKMNNQVAKKSKLSRQYQLDDLTHNDK